MSDESSPYAAVWGLKGGLFARIRRCASTCQFETRNTKMVKATLSAKMRRCGFVPGTRLARSPTGGLGHGLCSETVPSLPGTPESKLRVLQSPRNVAVDRLVPHAALWDHHPPSISVHDLNPRVTSYVLYTKCLPHGCSASNCSSALIVD